MKANTYNSRGAAPGPQCPSTRIPDDEMTRDRRGPNCECRRRAFTLVELLVVLGIVALLLGLLLPALQKARRSSRAAACAATLKGVGAGWVMYAQASPNELPHAISLPSALPPPAGQVTIMAALARQVPDAHAYRCAADDRDYFARYGTSYEYWPGILIALDPANARTLAQYAKHHPDQVPVLGDAEVFHPIPARPTRRLALYFDGHVDEFKTP
jgi:prepilin-type N-terminal cleavage/methylation domain-containing protein